MIKIQSIIIYLKNYSSWKANLKDKIYMVPKKLNKKNKFNRWRKKLINMFKLFKNMKKKHNFMNKKYKI